jgi:hypothetical protein
LFNSNLATIEKEEEEDKGGAVAASAKKGDIKETDNCWLL